MENTTPLIKNCQTCVHCHHDKYHIRNPHFDFCILTGYLCAVQRAVPNKVCDANLSGWQAIPPSPPILPPPPKKRKKMLKYFMIIHFWYCMGIFLCGLVMFSLHGSLKTSAGEIWFASVLCLGVYAILGMTRPYWLDKHKR